MQRRIHGAGIWLVGAGLFWLAGCARFHDQPLCPQESVATYEARSLANAGLKLFIEQNVHGQVKAWPPPSWDLSTLTLAAFYFHPDIDVARAELAAATAAQVTAGERPNPTVGVSPGYNYSAESSPWTLLVNFDIPIETMNKRGYRQAQARHLAEAARCHLAATAWQVRCQVRRNLQALASAQDAATQLARQVALQAESIQLMEGLLAAGSVSPFELSQARLAQGQVLLAQMESSRQATAARLQLAESLGLPPEALDGVELDVAAVQRLPAEIPDAAVQRQALNNRLDIRGALAEYAATQAALQLEIARQYPDIHLGPGYEYDQGENKWSLGLSVALPVFNQNQGAIAEAESRRRLSAARFVALQARVLSEIARAVADYRSSLQAVDVAQEQHRGQSARLDTATAMFKAGEISRAELMPLRLELAAADLAQLNAQARAQESLGTLEAALQCPAELAAVPELSPPSVQPRPSVQPPSVVPPPPPRRFP